MLHDLNVEWPHDDNPVSVTKQLALLRDLGYNVVALNNTLSGKVPKNYANPMSSHIDKIRTKFPTLKIYTRLTVVLDDSSQSINLSMLRPLYDLIAVRPMTERSLQNCCNLDPDLISLNVSSRLPFYLRHRTVCAAVEKGVRMEVCYAAGNATSEARKHVITNAASVIRAARSRGIVVSSGASSALDLRGPYDVTNLAVLWGLDHMRARDAIGKEASLVVRTAELRRNSYKQTVEEC